MTIQLDPTTCKPGEAYRVLVADCETVAMRPHNDGVPWCTIRRIEDCRWHPDSVVTVLHRLVPESDDVVDAEVEEDWTILRKAADAILHSGYDPTTLTTVLDVADYLTGQAGRIEADHRVAQEKVAADVAREALIVKAASVTVTHPNGAVVSVGLPYARALADAGYLVEAGEAS